MCLTQTQSVGACFLLTSFWQMDKHVLKNFRKKKFWTARIVLRNMTSEVKSEEKTVSLLQTIKSAIEKDPSLIKQCYLKLTLWSERKQFEEQRALAKFELSDDIFLQTDSAITARWIRSLLTPRPGHGVLPPDNDGNWREREDEAIFTKVLQVNINDGAHWITCEKNPDGKSYAIWQSVYGFCQLRKADITLPFPAQVASLRETIPKLIEGLQVKTWRFLVPYQLVEDTDALNSSLKSVVHLM